MSHLHTLEIRNKNGVFRELALECPESGHRQTGDIDDWAYCPWCGAELGEPTGVRVEDYTEGAG